MTQQETHSVSTPRQPASLAPILLFVYKRPDTLKRTIHSLQHNRLSSESELFIFSDNARSVADQAAVNEVRHYLKSITGFKQVHLVESPENKGLARSIISGVSQVINEYGRVIVLEDDLLLAPNFLSFMNAALDKYESNPKVYSVSGFMFDIPHARVPGRDVFFTKRHCSWGWAMWKDRWNEIDWEVKDFETFNGSPQLKKAFNHIGSDLSHSLIRQMKGEINSWAIRCNYHQFKKQTYTVYPLVSKVENMGFGDDATHTALRFNKYKASLDKEAKYDFQLPNEVSEDPHLLRKFKDKYSTKTRLYYYVLNKVFK